MSRSAHAVPDLSPIEWTEVRQTMLAVVDCGCAPRGVGRVFGKKRAQPALEPRQAAVRDYLCRSGGTDDASLIAQGFTLAQIAAMKLIAA